MALVATLLATRAAVRPDEDNPQLTRCQRALRSIAHNMHLFTFTPLVIMSVLQSHLALAALLSTGVVLIVLAAGFGLWRSGYIKVYPKPFDLFNVALYGSMVPLSLCAHDWLVRFVGLLTNGGNALFMWATILLPCSDCFVMHSVRDRVPDRILHHPLLRRMALLISVTWAVALSIMALGAVISCVVWPPARRPSALNIVCSYVLGLGPLVVAFPMQIWLTHHYKKRMMAQGQAQQEEQHDAMESGGQGKEVAGVVTAADKQADHEGAGDQCKPLAAVQAKGKDDLV